MEPESVASPSQRVRLDSWKEIAGHLQRDIRTVQRWEKLEGLPVYRHMHGERGTVYTYTDELDQWWTRRGAQPNGNDAAAAPARKLPWWPFAVAGVVLLAVVAVWLLHPTRPAPSRVPRVLGRLLAASTSEGRRPVLIPLPFPPFEVLLKPDGKELYIIHLNSVSVMDTRTNRITQNIPVGPRPTRAALSPDGARLYVGSGVADLSIIDTATKKVTTVSTGGPVTDLAVTPDGRKLFLASEYTGLKRLLTATGELAPLPGTVCPMYLAINPAGTRLYVSYQCGGPGGRPGHDAIDVVDIATERSVATFQGPPLVGGNISVTPDGQHIWVTGLDACSTPKYDHAGCPLIPAEVFHVIRARDLSLIQTLAFRVSQPSASEIHLYPDGSRAILTGLGIRVVDALRFTTTESIEGAPGHSYYSRFAIAPDGSRAYIPHGNPDEIAVFDILPSTCEPPQAGMQGFWPADGSTDDAHDGAPAELRNGAGFAPGLVGQAFRLDGVNGYVSVRQPFAGSITSTDGSIAAWVKFGKLGREMSIADRMSASGEIGWRLLVKPSGQFVFCLAGGTGCVTSSTLASAGRWYHVAGVRTASGLTLYVNGVSEASKPLAPPLVAEGVPDHAVMNLGASQVPGAFLEGLIDEVVLYRRPQSLGRSPVG
jgi:YVTN family beta-propeller protein